MAFNVSEVSLKEMFNNNNGKTSSTKFIGLVTSIVCLLMFIMLIIFYFCNTTEATTVLTIIDKVLTLFSVAAGLIGFKSFTSAFGKNQISFSNTIKLAAQQATITESEEALAEV